MPTENRSSNTEMVSVPRDLLERATNNKYIDKERISIHRHEALFAIRGMLAQPSQQHQGEPVARVWWTPVQGRVMVDFIKGRLAEGTLLYTHADPAEVERLRNVIEQQKNLIESLRAELVESYSIDASAEPSAPVEIDEMRDLLKSMTCSYRSAVQAGYDRITGLGGECDSVEKMLSDYPDYARARAALERKP